MATSNKREVELVIGVETTGQQSVKALSDAVNNLAKEGGDAAPEFKRLATELDRVAQQQDAIDTFAALRRQVAAVTEDMREAAASVDRLGAELPTAAANTRTFAEAQQTAAAALASARNDLAEMRAEQQRLREEYTGSQRRTEEYRVSNEQLKVTLSELRSEVKQKRTALKEAGDAAKEAAAAEKALSNAFNQSLVAARDLSSELARNNAALDRSREALQAVGISSTNLNAAQQQVRQSFAEIRAETEKQATALEETARATQQLVDAQRLLDAELEIQSASQREAIALEEKRAAAARESAAAIRAAAAQSAAALDAAFAKTGVRSAQAVESEIKEINEALNKLAFNARVSGTEFDRAFAAGQARIQKLRDELEGVPAEINKTGAATGYLKQQFSQLAAIYGGIELARAFIDANVQLETMRRSLAVVTGSTETAAQQIDFLRKTANDAGISVTGITDAFLRFNASAATAGIPLQTVNQLFGAITTTGGRLGLSSERVALALEALGQMASKGVVSMEELRGQLGDSFPGALSIAAKALNVTQAELVKLVENGQVLSEDFLPAFGQAIEREFGAAGAKVTGFAATWNELKNVMNEAFTTIGDTGALEALGNVLRGVGAAAGTMALGFSTALDTVILTVRSIAELVAGLAEGDLQGAFQRIGDMTEAAINRQAKFANTIRGLVGLGDEVAVSQNTAAAAIANTGTQAAQASVGHAANAQAQQQAAAAATENSAAQTAAGTSATTSGLAALQSAQGWYALLTAYNQAKTAAESATSAAVKNAEAEKLRGGVMVRVAELARDEVKALSEAAVASLNYANSAETVAAARQAEVTLTQTLITALQGEIAAKGQASDGQKKQLAELQQVLETKTAEAAKSSEAAAAARQEAVERTITAQTYRDNADALGTLRTEAENARVTLAALIELERQGQATSAQVTAARLEEAKAMALYSDAAQDAAARASALIAVKKAEASQTQANLQVEMARAQASEQFAITYQNEALQRNAQIEQRRIEVRMIQASTAAVVEEQNAIIAKEQAAAAELERTGQMNATKQLEIDARIKAAQAKITEADATKAKISAIQDEITEIIRQGETQAQVSQSNIGFIRSETQERLKNADAIREQKQAAEEKAAFDRQHTVSDNTGLASLQQKLENGTLSQDDLKVAQTVYDVTKGNLTAMQQSAPGTFSLRGRESVQSEFNAARMILERIQGMGTSLNSGRSGENAGGRTANRTVNINIPGFRSSTIGVTDEASERNLENVLRQLSTGASTSN